MGEAFSGRPQFRSTTLSRNNVPLTVMDSRDYLGRENHRHRAIQGKPAVPLMDLV